MSMYTSTKNDGFTFCSRLSLFILIAYCFFIASFHTFGQAANIDQIRNGPATNPQKWFFDNFSNPSWVNGNAGASTAHYVEGMSIGYRALLTGLTVNNVYEYVLEYDTKHSNKHALDYLTYYQRLEPHGPFNHQAEVIDPRIFENGSKEYLLRVVAGPNTFAIPAPGTTGTPISGQPLASYTSLPPAEKLMTIYNGTIQDITYNSQGNLSLAQTASSIKIRFTASKDSVVLAWGGHIASRIDWGFVSGVPRSAGGISGSPYHMRHLALKNITTNTNIPLGNQDMSLAAAAVIPPPECPTVPSQTICSGGTFGTFSIANPDAGTTYTWSISNNTAGAAFSGGTNTGTSVSIVKSGSGGFTSGSFTLNITAVKNGISKVCSGVATGSVEVTAVNATASPTTIDITSSAHSTTLTASIDASSTDADNTHYNYVWTIVTGAGNLSANNTRIVTYTADVTDAGAKLVFKVVATQKDDGDATTPECSAEDTVQVDVSTAGICGVSASDPVCAGTTVQHTGTPSPKPANATYTWSLQGYQNSDPASTTTATLSGSNGGTSIDVKANASYRIVLSQTYANTALNTSCFKDVSVTSTPSVSVTYNAPSCSEKTFSVDVNSPTIGFKYSITQPGDPGNTIADITPTVQDPTVHFAGLSAGNGYTVTVTTGGPGCTATSECTNNPAAPTSNKSVVDPASMNQLKKASDLKKVSDNVSDTYTITLPSGTKVKPLPNPYTDKVRFNLVSGVSGLAILELHNVLGQKIAVVYQGHIQAGVEITREFYVPSKDRGTLIYTFRVGEQKISGKLVPVR